MNIGNAFPSKYLRASDLQGKDVVVTMRTVTMEQMPEGENKPVLYFAGKNKGLVMNITNARRVEDMYGFETEAWTGKAITIYPTETEFRSEMRPCIRVRTERPYSMGSQPVVVPEPVHETVDDESIPF